MRAMDLHGAWAQAELRGHDLVRLAARHQPQHLTLARRERFELHANALMPFERLPILTIPHERALHAVDDVLIAERLLQEIERTVLHGFDCHGHIAMTGDENDREG